MEINLYARNVLNTHSIQLLVDHIPKQVKHKKVAYGSHVFYWGERDGYVHFLSLDEHDHSGFGGSTIPVLMQDGSVEELKGPWSSSSTTMNRYFPASVEVSITDSEDVFNHGYTYSSGAITIAKLQEAFQELNIKDFIIVPHIEKWGDMLFRVVRTHDPFDTRGDMDRDPESMFRPRNSKFTYRMDRGDRNERST
ncbi:MAG: hypothetical protein JRJ78_14155 [Deltaproteobacteria bacterium]|nr:hypothetical protein [Deltaproteobacteria bacterium]